METPTIGASSRIQKTEPKAVKKAESSPLPSDELRLSPKALERQKMASYVEKLHAMPNEKVEKGMARLLREVLF